MGFGHGEKPMLSEESIRPALVVPKTTAHSRALLLFAQYGAQPAADNAIHPSEDKRIRMLEVTKPAAQHRVQTLDNLSEARPTRTLGPGSDAILQGLDRKSVV